jgi:hypothetical protein
VAESELDKLDSLHEEGILSDEAYWEARSRMYAPPPSTHEPAAEPMPTAFPTPSAGQYPVAPISESPTEPVRKKGLRVVLLAVFVVLVLGTAAAGIAFLLRPQTSKARIGGTFALTDDTTASANCVGQGADSDVHSGTTVTLSGPDASTIATTQLASGVAAEGVCTYNFEFPETKTNLSAYTVTVTGRQPTTQTRAALKANDWHMDVHSGPPSGDITGTLELTDADTAAQNCVGTGGYDDISEGTNVVVKDQGGRILGSGSMDAGTSTDSVTCSYTFTVPNVRQDQQQYTLEISHRGGITQSESQLQAAGWSFSVTLGI